jgi:putative tryptophan/tyrosine transport system substrate-binding protein
VHRTRFQKERKIQKSAFFEFLFFPFLSIAFERGLNVGQNLQIYYRFGTVGVETIRTAVADILATSPDVILAHGTAVTAILQKQTQTVPVVFTVVSDPVGSGFIQSFAHPGGNLTGFTNFLEPSMGAKWVELLCG